ncbi:hypothetical protein METUNv1_01678 [Methyloversatilis universalis FAM5]|uniref:Uncharacterized protein n=1 Tax=Methyloversatilis universalis (strain ATCC BAA-1314 / DSM 25237 / JCM 13912 / CCUG 52030 / FAM5) TaxID=1000565 RepID=F5RC37_METUF|nr:hypothetical protein [Methyloversatilis universalis]EGK71900.1 hypothetical protein METUNv1_01678 [Methyloversatilis universalis FAM5]
MTYPSFLPRPVLDGYAIDPVDPVVRTDMEAGPIRRRRRSTNPPTRLNVSWVFSSLQMSVFEAWHKHSLQDGAAAFACPLVNGSGLQTWENVSFATMWKAVPEGPDVWRVTATLEAAERPVMSADALAGYL